MGSSRNFSCFYRNFTRPTRRLLNLRMVFSPPTTPLSGKFSFWFYINHDVIIGFSFWLHLIIHVTSLSRLVTFMIISYGLSLFFLISVCLFSLLLQRVLILFLVSYFCLG